MKTHKYRYAFSPHSHKNQMMKFIIYSFPVLKQVSSSTWFRENCYELNYYYVIWIHYSHNKYNFRSDYKYLSFLFSLYTSRRLSSFKIFQETSIFLKKGRGLEPSQHSLLSHQGNTDPNWGQEWRWASWGSESVPTALFEPKSVILQFRALSMELYWLLKNRSYLRHFSVLLITDLFQSPFYAVF